MAHGSATVASGSRSPISPMKSAAYLESSPVTPPSADYSPHLKPEDSVETRRKSEALADCYRVLTDVFGHTEYKGKQKEIVEAATLGTDVLVIAPTGMGKSLCFQIPAVADEHGVTIVISPLLALMKNQVSKLREHEIPVVSFTSETSATEKQQIILELQSGHPSFRLLYITPEKMCNNEFIELLESVYSNKELNRLVVDEAHCISEWGHDFRPEYRRLGFFRDHFPDVPIMALTASATASVQDDIVASLRISKAHMFKVVHPFNRSNLYYEVRYLRNPAPGPQMTDIYEYITTLHVRRKRPSSGIVYCRTRATCDELAGYLRGKGLSARPYHRGIPPATLDRTLEEWQIGGAGDGGVDVVVATIAFGCGIDKSDVRYIIHYDLPKSLEGYYQETGRAGRDGSPSKCIMYYSREDVIKVRKLVTMSHNSRQAKALMNEAPAPTQRTLDSLNTLIELAESTSVCRHVSICRYFGEQIDDSDEEIMERYCRKMCDICKYPGKTTRRKSVLSSAEFVSSQRPRLEREAKPAEDDDDMASCYGAHRKGPTLRVNRCQDEAPQMSKPSSSNLTRRKPSLELKRANPPFNDSGNATKKARISLPTLGSGLVSSHLQNTFKRPFKPPFKASSGSVHNAENISPRTPIYPRSPDSPPMDISEPSQSILGNPLPLDEEETEMFKNAVVDEVRSSSPIEIPEDDIEVDAGFSQKVPPHIRKEGLTSIRKALQKVFMHGNDHTVWKRLHMEASDQEIQSHLLAATAKDLEFLAHSYCSTADGYQARTYAQVSAVKLLKNDEAWGEDKDENEEYEDAREAVAILLRNSSATRKGKQRIS